MCKIQRKRNLAIFLKISKAFNLQPSNHSSGKLIKQKYLLTYKRTSLQNYTCTIVFNSKRPETKYLLLTIALILQNECASYIPISIEDF